MPLAINLIILVGLALLIPTAYAGKIGAPYAPTFAAAFRRAFDYIKLGPKDTVIDIGAGDGKVLLEAHRRGAKAIGYELSPIMWLVIALRTLGKSGITSKWRNFFKQQLPDATVVFIFLMPEHMAKVRDFLAKQRMPSAKYLLVYAFPLPKEITPLHIVHEPNCARLYIYDLKKLTAHSQPSVQQNIQ